MIFLWRPLIPSVLTRWRSCYEKGASLGSPMTTIWGYLLMFCRLIRNIYMSARKDVCLFYIEIKILRSCSRLQPKSFFCGDINITYLMTKDVLVDVDELGHVGQDQLP